MKRIIVMSMVTLVVAGMTGCAQPDMTDSQRTKAEGTGVGILGGALLGAAIGGEKGAAWGAALGGVAGYAYGSHVANEKSKYANEEDWLNACIASAHKVNKETRAYNAKLSKRIAETKRLVRLYKQGKISKSKLHAQKAIIDKERKIAKNMLAKAQSELKEQQKVLLAAKKSGQRAEAKRLNKEIATMKRENRKLKNQTDTLASLSALTAV